MECVKVPSFPFQPSQLHSPVASWVFFYELLISQPTSPIAGPWPSVHSGCLSSAAFLCGHDASPLPSSHRLWAQPSRWRDTPSGPAFSGVLQELARGNHPSPGTPACSAVLAERKHYCTGLLPLACSWPAILTTMEVSPSHLSSHLLYWL